MKKFAVSVAAVVAVALAALAELGGKDIIPVHERLRVLACEQEVSVAPNLGEEWKLHALASAIVTNVTDKTYTGSAITQSPVARLRDGTSLTANTDYTVSYLANTNAGHAAVVLTAKKLGYYGTCKVGFAILPANLSTATIGTISASTYTGSAICPTPTVTYGGTTLTKDTDYKLSYADNVNAGTGTVYVVGIGNYTGVKSKEFTINAAQ